MRSYRLIWWASAIFLGLLGVACAVLLASLLAALIILLVAGCCAGALSTSLRETDEPRPAAKRSVATIGLGAGGAAVALYGLGVLLGLAVVPLAALATVTSPAFVNWWRSRSQKPAGTSEAVAPEDDEWWLNWSEEQAPKDDAPPPPKASDAPMNSASAVNHDAIERHDDTSENVASMSDQELCMAWRRTFVDLERASSPQRIAGLASVRQRVLDELERRHRDAVIDWLASGARAAGDPSKYLDGGRTRPRNR